MGKPRKLSRSTERREANEEKKCGKECQVCGENILRLIESAHRAPSSTLAGWLAVCVECRREKRNVSWTRVDQMSRTHHCEWEFNWCVQINFPSSLHFFPLFFSFRPPKWKAKKTSYDAPEKPIKPTFFASGRSEEKCCFVCCVPCSTTHPDHDHVWRAMLMNSKRKFQSNFNFPFFCCHSSSLKVSDKASQVAMC